MESEKVIDDPTGPMPVDDLVTCLSVLSGFNPKVQGTSSDIAKMFTNEFVQKATPLS